MLKSIVRVFAVVVLGVVFTAAPFASKKASATPSIQRCMGFQFQPGSHDTGPTGCVHDIQEIMNEALVLYSFYRGSTTVAGWPSLGKDGNYGAQTKEAVKRFQRANHFSATGQDGIVGPTTWMVIYDQCVTVWPRAYGFHSSLCVG